MNFNHFGVIAHPRLGRFFAPQLLTAELLACASGMKEMEMGMNVLESTNIQTQRRKNGQKKSSETEDFLFRLIQRIRLAECSKLACP